MPVPPAGEAGGASVFTMLSMTRIGGLAGGVTCLGLAMLFGALPVQSEPQAQTVTSDTPEYCLQLLDKVSEMVRLADGPTPREVTYLSSEGQKMCDQGQTRGGILRLRRALMLMMRQGEGR